MINLTKENIKRLKNGTYGFRVSLGFDAVTGKRLQKQQSGFRTKKEAKVAYYQLLGQEQGPSTPSNITFGEFLTTVFEPSYKARVKPQTYANRSQMFKKRFKALERLPLVEIKPLDIQRWQNNLADEFKPAYARAVYVMLKVIFDYAVDLELLLRNPARNSNIQRKQAAPIEFWTLAEFRAVLATTDKTQYSGHFHYIMLWFMFTTGLRSGEARALTWDDIDFNAQTVNVNKTIFYRNANDYEFDAPKTSSSNRVVKLDTKTNEELLDWYEDQKMMLGAYSQFVFSLDGTPTRPLVFSDIINEHADQAGIKRIRVHGLRHSHASLLISMGENPLVIRDRLGHKDIKTTLGTYGHLYPNEDVKVAQKLSVLLGAPDKEASSVH